MKKLLAKVDTLSEQIKQVTSQNVTNNINNTANVSGDVHVNITMPKDFGYENTDHLAPQFLFQCLRNKTITDLIDKINYDPNHPENHNVRVKNIKKKQCEIVDDQVITVVHQDMVLDSMVDSGWRILSAYYDENKECIACNLDQEERRDISKWLSCLYFNNNLDSDEYINTMMKPTRDEVITCIKRVKDDLFMMMIGKKTVLLQCARRCAAYHADRTHADRTIGVAPGVAPPTTQTEP